MGGKASLLLVIGFSAIFLIFGNNYNTISGKAADNYFDYYIQTTAHNIAVSGANMAAREIFNNEEWVEGYTNIQMSGGELNVAVDNPYYPGNDKVEICHIPPGNPDNKHTIMVSQNAVDAHLAHGDHLGDCNNNFTNENRIITIVSEGTVYGLNNEPTTASVVVQIQPSSFSKFAYFSDSEGSNIWWTNNDEIWGPMHTNDFIRCYRHPQFHNKVTTRRGVKYYSSYSNDYPIIEGDYQKGVIIDIPSDGVSKVKTEASTNGYVFTGYSDVYMLFDGDSIKYKFAEADDYTAKLGSELAPNGVIYIDNGSLKVEGVVKGRYTVGVGGASSDDGNVHLTGNLTYATDPQVNSASTDMLGIVALRDVMISNNVKNNAGDFNLHASVYCQQGSFGASDHDSRPKAGNINLLGGIIQKTRGAVGTFGGGGTGYGKRYRYDNRLLYVAPPAFPGTGKFEILSWYE